MGAPSSLTTMLTIVSFSLAPVYPFPCEVDPSVFEVPQGYTMLGAGRTEPMRDEDDDLLQFAIQQSLLDAGTETDQVRAAAGLCGERCRSIQPYQSDVSSLSGLWNQGK